jgi:hypothetical protein
MVGFPEETDWGDTKETLAFMSHLKRLTPNAMAEYFYYTPFPGTPLFRRFEKNYLPKHDTIEDYINFNTYGPSMPWVDERLPRLLKMATRFYFKFSIPGDKMLGRMEGRGPAALLLRLMRRISDWRVRNRRYGFAFEYALARLFKEVLMRRLGLFKGIREVL